MEKLFKRIDKTIINSDLKERYYDDILLFEVNNIKDLDIETENIKLFRSSRHKNDMPTVLEFGKMNKCMKDALISISESGDKIKKEKSNYIISDSLTILGNERKAFLIEFIGGFKHLIKTMIKIDERGNFINLKVFAELNILLKPNESFDLEPLELIYIDDVYLSIDNYTNKFNFKRKLITPPFVYSTWYYYGQKINFYDCITNLKKIKEYNLLFDVFQIDDGWMDYIGDYNPNNKFNLSLDELAKTIKEYNLIPGIWTSPFIVDRKSNFYNEHKDWILNDNNNQPVIFNVNNYDYYVLDITISDTWNYLEKLYSNLRNKGFKYHKIDFTRAPLINKNANYKNKYITPITAYRNACLSIRKGIKEDSFLLMCGGLFETLIGIADGMRTGSDILSMWKKNIGGGKSLPYTMKQSLLRYYMNKWWFNDPDALMIRDNKIMDKGGKLSLGLLNKEEIKTSLINELLGCGLISTTEALDKISRKLLENYKHIVPIRNIRIKIDNLLNIKRYPNCIKLKEENYY